MQWTNPQANIEQILNVFSACASAFFLMGPITREQLVEYCKETYQAPIGVKTKGDETWVYSQTWNNTYISAMFKFGMLQYDGKLIDLTPAGYQLYNHEITPEQFFSRQLVEYQYDNPFNNVEKTNIFPMWILLKLLSLVETLDYYEAVYIVLKIDKYSDCVLNDTIEKINVLRKLKSKYDLKIQMNEFLEKLDENFGSKVSNAKAWQYERNYLLWTFFCEKADGTKEIRLKSDMKMKLDKVLSTYPNYQNFNDKEEYSKYIGRKFLNERRYYYLKEDSDVIIDKNSDSIIDLKVKCSSLYLQKGDLLLIALLKDDYNIKSIWRVTNIKVLKDEIELSCYRHQDLKRDIPFQEMLNLIR